MFETEGYAQVPVHEALRRSGHSTWEFVYRTARVPWLHATLGRSVDGMVVYDAYFLNDVWRYKDLVRAGLQPKHLDLVMPVKSGAWTLKAVSAIWEVNAASGADTFLQFKRGGGYLSLSAKILNDKELNAIQKCTLVCVLSD